MWPSSGTCTSPITRMTWPIPSSCPGSACAASRITTGWRPSWIDPGPMEGWPPVSQLLSRGRDFAEEDKEPVIAAQFDAMRRVLPAYRALRERGQAELTTSPFYHPILPLIRDLEAARTASPSIQLPDRPFAHPEDAAEQLRLAVETHRRLFGTAPQGLWPPELALSDEVPFLA